VPAGNHHPLVSPHGTFQAADRPFNISVGNPAMWKKFVVLIGRPDLEQDERFHGVRRRVQNRAALSAEVNAALAAHRADYWIDELNKAGIPSGPILTMEEIFAHPQIAAREMLLRIPHPRLGTFLTTGLGVKLDQSPGRVTRPPLFGEHTDEVLAAHGFGPEERARLRAEGVIA
jgi:crotonobetainyl-CoA:carnitine CoA-transferase CaiB-like acyl-CoA transferase